MASCGGSSKKSADIEPAEVENEETEDESSSSSDNVYICTGGSSERYHSSPDCRGLGRCSGEIEEVSEEEAEDMGRTPCKICY